MTKWIKPPIDDAQVRSIAESHKLDFLTSVILSRRAMTAPEQIAFFLENDERFLHNPFLLDQMESAVARVLAAVEEGEKVLVCGDKDVDGITSTVLMVETLRSLGLDPAWRVPVGDELYGLNGEVLKKAAADDVTLLITVDCGISEFEEIALAVELGMDILVFDHHVPRDDKMPAAYALVNPKLPGGYPFTGLCAAAIVSKFQWAVCLAGTDLWEQEFCLLNAEKLSDSSIVIEALKMRNLAELHRIQAVDGDGEMARNKLFRFIEGMPLLVYGQAEQTALISRFFNGADVHVIDIEPEVTAVFPALKGHSLKSLGSQSRLARYFTNSGGLINTFANLFITLYTRRYSSAFELWRRGLDLAALGTLADLMPLVDENRILVNRGMMRLNAADGIKFRRSALRELLIRQRLHEGWVSTVELSWQICPLINSTGRLGKAAMGVELLLSEDEARIRELADEMVNLNKERRALGEQLWEQIYPQAYQSMQDMEGQMSIVTNNDAPRGITGRLASRLQNTLGIASVVISQKGELASGSVRCGSGMNAVSWLEAMAPLLEDYGGHPKAGGFCLKKEKIDLLINQSREWLKNNPPPPAAQKPIVIDAELSHSEYKRLGTKGIETLLNWFEPYGEGFRPLIFLTRSVRIHSAELIGKTRSNHLKLLVSLGPEKWTALWWDSADRYGTDIKIDGEADLVYHIEKDRWRGADTYRLMVLEASSCAT
ncbi:MAG: single-stranded-DNA-specific exonuclease RecJ [Spirochaeta sp. LUC14_002_19_P3]|nr:MAG: single-stranded-DNA-specific exonuclease RecJ [Spirochaeta sp. LUC14_002_19_P3]